MVLFALIYVLLFHYEYLVVCLGVVLLSVGYLCVRNMCVFECWCVLKGIFIQ